MSFFNTFYQGFAKVVIISFIMTVAYIAYLLWWPMEAIKYDSTLLEIATSHISVDCGKTKDGLYVFRPGDVVPLRVSGHKYIDTPGLVMPRYVDSTVTILPDYTARRTRGRFDEVSLTHRVPRGSQPGIHYFDFTVVYEVNPLRKLTYQTRSVPFWVEPRPVCTDCKKRHG